MEKQVETVIITPESLVKDLLREKGLRKRDLADTMRISYPTLQKYLTNPETMSGDNRAWMAVGLGISLELVDDICNRNFEKFTHK